MQINLIQNDGKEISLEIPELDNYPDVMFSGSRAFKKHSHTDEYIECSLYYLPSAIVSGIDYLVAAVALVKASEHLETLLCDVENQQALSSALTWRLRCALEAITLIKNRTPEEIEKFLQENYPSGV